MKFKILSESEFQEFALRHEQKNFHQTLGWAYLKTKNGWTKHFVGLVKDNQILAGSLILAKKIFGPYKVFYAPRGFLIDYKDYDLLRKFTFEIKKFIKKQHGFLVKIDPYVMHQERDINGRLIKEGLDNSSIIQHLLTLGYKHYGYTVYQETLQPRWLFVLDIQNKTTDQILKEVYNQTTRRNINKALQLTYEIEAITGNNIDIFKDIMEKTSLRRDFIDRPLSYYKNMYEILTKYNMFKGVLIKFNCSKSIAQLNQKNLALTNQINSIKQKLEEKYNSMRLKKQITALETNIKNNNKKCADIKKLQKEYGNLITMSGAIFITYGDEVLYLSSGSYEQFFNFDAVYFMQWEMIKYAIHHGYKKYNFYGISGAFDKKDPSYGVYFFKKGFNGKVVELIGEFDLIINYPLYYLYKISFALYSKLQKTKHKLKKMMYN